MTESSVTGGGDGPVGPVEVHKQQYAHFGRLNDTLYKLPGIFAAVMGGLWYFAVGQVGKDRVIACAVFVFSAAVSCTCAVSAWRLRQAFNGYLDRLNSLDGRWRVSLQPTGKLVPSTLRALTYLMCLAAALSLLGACYAVLR